MVKTGGARARSSAGFDPAMIDLGLEILLFLVIQVLMGVVINAGAFRLIGEMPRLLGLLSTEPSEDALLLQQMASTLRPADLLGDAVMSGILLTFSTLVSNGVIYVVGILFGGAGELFKLMGSLFRVQIIMSIVQTICLALAVSGVFLHAPLEVLLTLSIAGLGLTVVSGLAQFIWLVYAVGRGHEVGFIKGAFIVLVGGVVTGILWSLFGIFSA